MQALLRNSIDESSLVLRQPTHYNQRPCLRIKFRNWNETYRAEGESLFFKDKYQRPVLRLKVPDLELKFADGFYIGSGGYLAYSVAPAVGLLMPVAVVQTSRERSTTTIVSAA